MSVQTEDDLWGPRPEERRDRLMTAFVTSLVAMVMDVPARDIAARHRTHSAAARARQTAIYLAHVVLGWPLQRVARAFGRDRSTASYAVQLIEDLRDDPAFDNTLTAMEASVQHAAQSAEPG